MANEYVLVERTSRRGRNGVTFWRFTFYCLADGLFYETTVDETYRNFQRSGWEDLTRDNPYGVYEGLTRTQRITKQGMPVITADSSPRSIAKCQDFNEAMRIVCANENIDFPGDPPNTFSEIISYDD